MPTEPMMREVEMPELLEVEGGIFGAILLGVVFGWVFWNWY